MWYYESDGSSRGPVDIAEIRRLIAVGHIARSTRVWRDGFRDWMPAEQTELAASFAHGAAPPPVPAQASEPAVPPLHGAIPVQAPAVAAMPARLEPAYGQAEYAVGRYAPDPYAGGVRYAGFWIRVGAYLIDAILASLAGGILGGLIGAVIGFIAVASRGSMNEGLLTIAGNGIGLAVGLFWFCWIPASRWQATPGKRIVGIRLIRSSGADVTIGTAIGRYFSYILSGLILGIGFMMAGWTDQKRALHDMICDTRVIYGRT